MPDHRDTTARETEFGGLSGCRCGARPVFVDARCLAFIVRCKSCKRQTGMERCAQDAWVAWEIGALHAATRAAFACATITLPIDPQTRD